MTTLTKKGQVTIPKPFREKLKLKEGDSLVFDMKDKKLFLRKREKKSILSLGGIAKSRKVGVGSEREYTKKVVSKKLAQEGLKDG
jgi:AbrB family looped-hinge helix DNA binding protein